MLGFRTIISIISLISLILLFSCNNDSSSSSQESKMSLETHEGIHSASDGTEEGVDDEIILEEEDVGKCSLDEKDKSHCK